MAGGGHAVKRFFGCINVGEVDETFERVQPIAPNSMESTAVIVGRPFRFFGSMIRIVTSWSFSPSIRHRLIVYEVQSRPLIALERPLAQTQQKTASCAKLSSGQILINVCFSVTRTSVFHAGKANVVTSIVNVSASGSVSPPPLTGQGQGRGLTPLAASGPRPAFARFHWCAVEPDPIRP